MLLAAVGSGVAANEREVIAAIRDSGYAPGFFSSVRPGTTLADPGF
jgi:hypothetical protein